MSLTSSMIVLPSAFIIYWAVNLVLISVSVPMDCGDDGAINGSDADSWSAAVGLRLYIGDGLSMTSGSAPIEAHIQQGTFIGHDYRMVCRGEILPVTTSQITDWGLSKASPFEIRSMATRLRDLVLVGRPCDLILAHRSHDLIFAHRSLDLILAEGFSEFSQNVYFGALTSTLKNINHSHTN